MGDSFGYIFSVFIPIALDKYLNIRGISPAAFSIQTLIDISSNAPLESVFGKLGECPFWSKSHDGYVRLKIE